MIQKKSQGLFLKKGSGPPTNFLHKYMHIAAHKKQNGWLMYQNWFKVQNYNGSKVIQLDFGLDNVVRNKGCWEQVG